jgi:hypothetical protein
MLALSTCGSTSVKRVGIYTGATLAALAAVASRTTICGLQSVSTFMATAGVTYRIAVDEPLHAPGDILLKLSPPPPNDDVADVIAISAATATITGTNVGADLEDGEPAGRAQPRRIVGLVALDGARPARRDDRHLREHVQHHARGLRGHQRRIAPEGRRQRRRVRPAEQRQAAPRSRSQHSPGSARAGPDARSPSRPSPAAA